MLLFHLYDAWRLPCAFTRRQDRGRFDNATISFTNAWWITPSRNHAFFVLAFIGRASAFLRDFLIQNLSHCQRFYFAAGCTTEAIDFEKRVATEFEADEIT